MPNSNSHIAVIKGDGIGVDVTNSSLTVLEAAQRRTGGFALEFSEIKAGAAYFLESGYDIEPGGESAAASADAIFLGAIGLPSVRHRDGTEISPHLRLRERLQLYAGVRPVKAYPNAPKMLAHARAAEIDMVVLRESTEGLFYSAAIHNRSTIIGDEEVRETLRITRTTSEKLHDFAFRLAQKRKRRGGKGKVTCVDKANVFHSMAFFRKIFNERALNFPDIESSCNYVDAQALDLIRQPWEYDVLVMENMFGDIFSDLAGGLVGGMGIACCAEIGDEHGLFQPAHGSAPDIMGQDRANPLAAILSAAMMLDYLYERTGVQALSDAALTIEAAVEKGFAENRIRPVEYGGDQGTVEVTSSIVDLIHERAAGNRSENHI